MMSTTDACFQGYASIFNVPDRHGDIMLPGAFLKSLAAYKSETRTPRLLWQHSAGSPIGVLITLQEDARGLYVKGLLPSTSHAAREAAALIQSGALDGLSIGFKIVKSRCGPPAKGGKPYRLLEEVELYEISIVTFAAHPLARIFKTQ